MYFLGIDGGGTKTKCYVIDENKNVIYIGNGGPSSLDTVTNEKTIKHINDSLDDFFKKYPKATFEVVFAGLGGVPNKKYEEKLTKLLIDVKGITKDTIRVGKSDMENALYSGLCFDEGISLIAGTGMVCFGKNKSGITKRTGGLGFKEGDMGSGYSLGKMALSILAKASDGRIDETNFTKELKYYFNINEPSDVARVCEELFLERTKVASLAPIVTTNANKGDKYANEIIEIATSELSLCVETVYKALNVLKIDLVVVGTLGNIEGNFKKSLHEKIKKINNNINIIEPKVDPAHAASLMAYEIYKKRV